MSRCGLFDAYFKATHSKFFINVLIKFNSSFIMLFKIDRTVFKADISWVIEIRIRIFLIVKVFLRISFSNSFDILVFKKNFSRYTGFYIAYIAYAYIEIERA
ncbi:hypothetical protein D3C73_1357510 [compost metagenome]